MPKDKFNFGPRSLRNLQGVDPRLKRVVTTAIRLGVMDFSVTCGVRTQEEQDRLYALGRTEPGKIVTWTRKSNHLSGRAVDLAPYPIDWNSYDRFHQLAGVIKSAAAIEGVSIKWGGDFKKSIDLPHFELAEK